MDLDANICAALSQTRWFSRSGEPTDANDESVARRTESRDEALGTVTSRGWQSFRIDALGDLTEYLHEHDLNHYALWNRLATRSQGIIQADLRSVISESLEIRGLSSALDAVLFDIHAIQMFHAYRRSHRNLPAFYSQIWNIYRCGRLPCGWIGKRWSWPNGQFVMY